MCCINRKDTSHQMTSNQLSACNVTARKFQVFSQENEALCSLKDKTKLPGFYSVKFKAHLVGTYEAQAQGGQDLDDCRAAVALDWVVGLQLWHCVLPACMLTHQGTEVSHHKRPLLHLGRQKGLSTASPSTQTPDQTTMAGSL